MCIYKICVMVCRSILVMTKWHFFSWLFRTLKFKHIFSEWWKTWNASFILGKLLHVQALSWGKLLSKSLRLLHPAPPRQRKLSHHQLASWRHLGCRRKQWWTSGEPFLAANSSCMLGGRLGLWEQQSRLQIEMPGSILGLG